MRGLVLDGDDDNDGDGFDFNFICGRLRFFNGIFFCCRVTCCGGMNDLSGRDVISGGTTIRVGWDGAGIWTEWLGDSITLTILGRGWGVGWGTGFDGGTS